jgi:hypothetical protein
MLQMPTISNYSKRYQDIIILQIPHAEFLRWRQLIQLHLLARRSWPCWHLFCFHQETSRSLVAMDFS